MFAVRALTSILLSMAIAQNPPAPKPEKDNGAKESKPEKPANADPMVGREVKVIPLQYSTPDSIMDTMVPLFRSTPMTSNAATNSLIVTGSPQELTAISELVSKLDKPSDQAKNSTPGIRTIQLRHRATDDVSKKLMSLLGGMRDRDARVASDEGRGKLILRGSPDFLEFAGQVISELDVPAQMIQFEFAFFSADQNAAATGESDDAGRIPNDLSAVAKELERFGRVKLLGRLACNAMEDHQFVLEGSLGEGLSAKVSGAIINAVTDGTIQLSVQGQVRLTRPATGNGGAPMPPRSSAFDINTTVVTRRGDTIMIGSAPTGWAQGESAIMVLQAKN